MLGFLAYGAFYLLMFRGLQVVGSLVALTTITTGFRNVDWLAGGSSSMLGSHTTTFAMLMSYTAMLYSLHQLFAVHLLCYVAPFPRLITVGMDFLLAIALLISSILLVTSDYIRHCDLYGNAIHCNNLKVGLVFEFLACGAFLCCAALIYSGEVGPWGVSEDREIGVQVSRGGDAPHHPLSPVVISTPIPSDKI